jgi:CHAD domain-containing protein
LASPALLFELPPEPSVDEVESALAGRLGYARRAVERLDHVYLDTFDWRLYQAGVVLESFVSAGVARLRWRGLGTGIVLFDKVVPALPRFAWDLPEGELRRRLGRCIEVRALLPVARLGERRTSGSVLDAEGKTVLRLEIWEPRARAAARRLLLLLPVRGYDKPLRRAARAAAKALGGVPDPLDPMLALTLDLARPPSDYAHRHSVRLEPAMRADQACKLILAELVAVMRENEEGVLGDVDSEFLHEYRVAMRRTRSLLTQIKQVFPESRLRRFREGFRWLGQLTGPPRDMDVYLLSFEEYRTAVPASLGDALEPLREEIALVKSQTYRTLGTAIASARYQRLIADWQRFVASPVPGRATSANAMRPVFDVACERTWRLYRAVLAEGRAIGPETPAGALHALRKRCKKLRYVVEFFRSLFPARDVARAVRVLKRLQDVLGSFQDFEIQQHEIAGLRARLEARGALDARAAKALDLLVADLAARQRVAREDFARRFEDFDTSKHRRAYRALYRPRKELRKDRGQDRGKLRGKLRGAAA